ncbi:MAG TPA: cytochrome c peroxidase [Thermoleophilia bacterium]|nr:cytochrome c peroxidase [Thermoleophilia bacterium]
MRHGKTIVLVTAALVTLLCVAAPAFAATLTPVEELGKALFFDENLSLNRDQSCATCHAPEVGWTGPTAAINAHGAVYEGSDPGMFGDRKPPTSAYGGDSPVLHYDEVAGLWIGGMFWDGRATGWTLGDPLAEQAQGPFLNSREQALASSDDVIAAVKLSTYAGLFEQVWGPDSLDADVAYDYVGLSIAAYEASSEVNPFSSKYDAWVAGKAKLTRPEMQGFRLFMNKGKCGNCHVPPLFTDFTYDNLGIPKNLENPVYTWNSIYWVDPGLGGFLKSMAEPESVWAAEMGKHKVPTLRNVDLRPSPDFVKAYGHNGYFKSLRDIVHFYNTRDVAVWDPPEYAATVNTTEMGNLRLTAVQEKAIVTFMKTLSDGYLPQGR